MALTLANAGGEQFVTGVYEDQGNSPINIGTIARTFGGNTNPLVAGFSSPDDLTVNVKAFFDPSLSPTASQGQYNQIGFIQTGEFLISGVPLSVYFQNQKAPYPVYNQLSRNKTPLSFRWVNAPKQFNNPAVKLLFPDYPLWTLLENPNLTLPSLFKYPQENGGYTKFNPGGSAWQSGDNLCATLNFNLELALNDLPFDTFGRTYFNTLDFSTLEKTVTIKSDNPFINIPYKAPNLKLFLFDKNLIPAEAQIKQVQNLNRQTFFLIEYYDFLKRGNTQVKLLTQGVVWKDQDGVYFTLIDEDLIEQWEEDEKKYGRPDIPAINKLIFDKYKLFIRDLSLENFRLSYRYYTYACGINIDPGSKTYKLDLFEGFGMEIHRQYSYIINGSEEWLPITVNTFPMTSDLQAKFLNTVKVFFKNQNTEYKLVLPLTF